MPGLLWTTEDMGLMWTAEDCPDKSKPDRTAWDRSVGFEVYACGSASAHVPPTGMRQDGKPQVPDTKPAGWAKWPCKHHGKALFTSIKDFPCAAPLPAAAAARESLSGEQQLVRVRERIAKRDAAAAGTVPVGVPLTNPPEPPPANPQGQLASGGAAAPLPAAAPATEHGHKRKACDKPAADENADILVGDDRRQKVARASSQGAAPRAATPPRAAAPPREAAPPPTPHAVPTIEIEIDFAQNPVFNDMDARPDDLVAAAGGQDTLRSLAKQVMAGPPKISQKCIADVYGFSAGDLSQWLRSKKNRQL